MNKIQKLLLGGGVIALIVFLWLLIPPGAGIKGQLRWLLQGAVVLATWIIGFIAWVLEMVVLFIGPWILGWLLRRAVTRLDEAWTPDKDISRLFGFLLQAGLTVVVFLFWLLVPLVIMWVPPASTSFPGLWIRSHQETGLVWWGVYAALAYMLFPPMRSFVKFASY